MFPFAHTNYLASNVNFYLMNSLSQQSGVGAQYSCIALELAAHAKYTFSHHQVPKATAIRRMLTRLLFYSNRPKKSNPVGEVIGKNVGNFNGNFIL